MSLITGPNGNTFTTVGNSMFKDGKHMGSSIGNSAFGPHGQNMFITKSGNQYFVNGKMYTLSGNILFGPNGKMWSGTGMSDSDVRNIIMADNS